MNIVYVMFMMVFLFFSFQLTGDVEESNKEEVQPLPSSKPIEGEDGEHGGFSQNGKNGKNGKNGGRGGNGGNSWWGTGGNGGNGGDSD